jgi:hypothetical protein
MSPRTSIIAFTLVPRPGSMANVVELMIPYDYPDKVFLAHLHI